MSPREEKQFLTRFDSFWRTLTAFERVHEHFRLDPKRRYWIDTYPPMNVLQSHAVGTGPTCDFGQISRDTCEDVFSLYLHIGFCRRRCAYCRQYEISVVGNRDSSDLFEAYTNALKRDIDVALEVLPGLRDRSRSLYFGGGTPSILPVRTLGSLLEHLFRSVDLSCLSDNSTFELHPEDDSDSLLELLRAAGFPRVSVGVQSFHEPVLRTIGRPCSEAEILRTIQRVADHGFITNVDLINGLHQDFAVWQREVEVVGALLQQGTIHSATIYMLHPFPDAHLRCDSSHEYWQTRNMYFARDHLIHRLGMHERPIYWFHKDAPEEIDAFAPTYSILGLGNSSYSCLGPWLLQNHRSLEPYLAHKRGSGSSATLPVAHCCRLRPAQMHTRALLFAVRSGSFRLGESGLDRIGAGFRSILGSLVRDGLLTCSGDAYTLTEIGKIFAHQIPIMFFDTDVRLQLEKYLDSRFPVAGASWRHRLGRERR